MSLTRKERHRLKLLEYLSDPRNDFPTRTFLSQNVLGYKQAIQINKVFTPDELQEIEFEALAERRKRCAKHSIKVDNNLIKQAQESENPKWAELYYEKYEEWKRTQKVENTGKNGGPIKFDEKVTVEFVDADANSITEET